MSEYSLITKRGYSDLSVKPKNTGTPRRPMCLNCRLQFIDTVHNCKICKDEKLKIVRTRGRDYFTTVRPLIEVQRERNTIYMALLQECGGNHEQATKLMDEHRKPSNVIFPDTVASMGCSEGTPEKEVTQQKKGTLAGW